jgi:hypothetical protein
MEAVALEGQSFLDLAIQGGSRESVFKIDATISITDYPVIGKKYAVEIASVPIANYYKNNQINPATMITQEDIDNQAGGIGVMAIGTSFIVR